MYDFDINGIVLHYVCVSVEILIPAVNHLDGCHFCTHFLGLNASPPHISSLLKCHSCSSECSPQPGNKQKAAVIIVQTFWNNLLPVFRNLHWWSKFLTMEAV
jgi:hypothetical protein